ncbi:hypothetical protein ACE3MQ_05835 [Paenibacillus lentus]|uniref:hypothetical protein n=1 Tax=Paenibacillus lentus TaxID=1338368 RepID=UPI00365BFBB7
MFEIEVKDIFRITGRGFVIGGEVIFRDTVLRNGDTLINRNNKEQKIFVKSIESVGSSRICLLKPLGLVKQER